MACIQFLCPACGTGPLIREFCRLYFRPLTPKTTPSRFSPGRLAKTAFEVLYLAENPLVAMFEVRALYGSPSAPGGVVPHPSRPLVVLPITVRLSDVADLTVPSEAAKVDTNAQELTGDWRSYSTWTSAPPHSGTPPTQEFGEELYRLENIPGADFVLGDSARLQDSCCFSSPFDGSERLRKILLSTNSVISSVGLLSASMR